MSKDLRINQEWERKETEECTHYIDDSRVNYQSLINDIHQFEIVFKTAKDVILSARMAIAKT